jgi:hypothetical protein
MERERPTIHTEELIIYIGLVLIGAIRVTQQLVEGGAWGAGGTVGLALVVLGLLALVLRTVPRRRSRS